MPIETIKFNNQLYPAFQAEGNFMQYLIPFANKVCQGKGVDIGCKKLEWAFPGARPIDIEFNELDENGKLIEAYNLPEKDYDYIISSHCLEHLPNWVDALEYWGSCLKSGGVLCLYLPHNHQTYWEPFNNRKHIHSFSPYLLERYFSDMYNQKSAGDGKTRWNQSKIFISERDINHSFIVIVEKE